jgi:isocitrate dehydrogenase
MKRHPVTLILGDGTGPELAHVTKDVLDATGVAFDWTIAHAGIDIMETAGTPLPQETLEAIKATKTCIKAPITTPVGTGFRSVNVALRKEFDLYACVRPCKTYQGVRSRYDNIDLVIFRENTEDLYAGIEFEKGSEKALKLIEHIKELSGVKIRPDSGISIKPISVFGTERIVRAAFEYARKKGRKKVTAVHKSNIMKIASSTTWRCSWCKSPRTTMSSCCRTCTAMCSAICALASSAAWASRLVRTRAMAASRSSKPRTVLLRSTRASTRSTRRRCCSRAC